MIKKILVAPALKHHRLRCSSRGFDPVNIPLKNQGPSEQMVGALAKFTYGNTSGVASLFRKMHFLN